MSLLDLWLVGSWADFGMGFHYFDCSAGFDVDLLHLCLADSLADFGMGFHFGLVDLTDPHLYCKEIIRITRTGTNNRFQLNIFHL